MARLHIYILDKDLMPQLRVAMQKMSLDLEEMGALKRTTEADEQQWKCCDKTGDIFYFSACEASGGNGLGLKVGTFFLIEGPGARNRKRKEIAAAFEHFEQALDAMGAEKM